MSSLRRSESVLFLPTTPQTQLSYARSAQRSSKRKKTNDNQQLTIRTTRAIPSNVPSDPITPPPQPRSRKSSIRPSSSSCTSPSTRKLTAPSQIILPSPSSPILQLKTSRTTSPLSPTGPRHTFPGRPVFPRSKPEPDLYKVAIKARMRETPVGQQILHMGPRLAMSIYLATQELERMVEDGCGGGSSEDVVMSDYTPYSVSSVGGGGCSPPSASSTWSRQATNPALPVLTASWVVVRGNEDWEMVDCAA